MFPLPAPGSVPQKAPIPWDPGAPFAGMGWRDVKAEVSSKSLDLTIEEKNVRG
jgi:hypothetical protein